MFTFGHLNLILLCAAAAFAGPYGENEAGEEFNISEEVRYCQSQTPCAWRIYDVHKAKHTFYVKNDYCKCLPDAESCEQFRVEGGYIEHRCRKKHKGD